jgi:hypothetical protein
MWCGDAHVKRSTCMWCGDAHVKRSTGAVVWRRTCQEVYGTCTAASDWHMLLTAQSHREGAVCAAIWSDLSVAVAAAGRASRSLCGLTLKRVSAEGVRVRAGARVREPRIMMSKRHVVVVMVVRGFT